MANTITLSTAGKIAYEDFAGQTDGDNAVSSEFTLTTPAGKNFKVATVAGEKCIGAEDNTFYYDNCAVSTKYTNTNKEILLQKLHRGTGLHDRQSLSFYKLVGAAGRWKLENYISNVAWWTTDGRFAAFTSPRGDEANVWFLIQTYLSETINEYKIIKQATGLPVTGQHSSYKTGFDFATDEQDYAFTMDSRGGALYHTKYLMARSRYLTVAGLVAGMAIQLLDASDTVMQTRQASGASVSFDLFGILQPVSYKFKVFGTDGSVLLTTTAQTIFGGDTWTYSGDTAGASGGGAINVINNNM